MKVKNLRKALDKLPSKYDEAIVILSKDVEGNDHSPLSNISASHSNRYIARNSFSGDIEKLSSKGEFCIVLKPIN